MFRSKITTAEIKNMERWQLKRLASDLTLPEHTRTRIQRELNSRGKRTLTNERKDEILTNFILEKFPCEKEAKDIMKNR